MMPITVACPCGWSRALKEEYAGKRTKCPSCGGPIVVPAVESDAEAAAAQALLADDPTPSPTAEPATPETEAAPAAPRRLPTATAKQERVPSPPKKIDIEYKTRKESSSRPSGIAISPGVAGALGLILCGGLWIAVRLASDRVPIYGVVLVCLGALRLIGGLLGRPEE